MTPEQLEKQASIIEESAVHAFRDGDFRHAEQLKLAARSLRWQAGEMRMQSSGVREKP